MSEMLPLLTELIRLKPVSSDVAAVNRAADRMQEYLSRQGLFCRMEEIGGRHTLYAAAAPGKETDYLLNAHLDVVPGAPEQFEPVVSDGVITARGASDCLGNAVALARTLVLLKDSGVSCGVIFSTDEEIGGFTAKGMVERGYRARKGIIIADSAYGCVTCAEKGMLSLELTARSATGGGHASRPWQYDNPIDRLLEGYLRLRESWKNPVESDQWQNSLAACVVRAGEVHNQIPDTASLILNIRYIAPEDKEKLLRRVAEYTGCECKLIESCPPVVFDQELPMYQQLRTVMSRHITDREITMARMNGATDARHFSVLGVPIAMLGLNGSGSHSPKECLHYDSITVMSDILAEFLREA